MAAHAKSFDSMLNTAAAPHDLDAFFAFLKRDVTMVGAPATLHPSPDMFGLIMKRYSLAGSLIGGIPKRRRCWISAPSTALSRISKWSAPTKSMKPMSTCSRAM